MLVTLDISIHMVSVSRGTTCITGKKMQKALFSCIHFGRSHIFDFESWGNIRDCIKGELWLYRVSFVDGNPLTVRELKRVRCIYFPCLLTQVLIYSGVNPRWGVHTQPPTVTWLISSPSTKSHTTAVSCSHSIQKQGTEKTWMKMLVSEKNNCNPKPTQRKVAPTKWQWIGWS